MSNFGRAEYRTNANDRATRMQIKINALQEQQKKQIQQQLQALQQKQIDDICGILANAGIREPKAEITTIDDVNDLFRNFGLSGGRKSRRRKSRKSMKSRRRR
jgi:hypothetical protein